MKTVKELSAQERKMLADFQLRNSQQRGRTMTRTSYTAIIEKEGAGYVALYPELGVASQGTSVEEAPATFKEIVDLFLECADPEEVGRRCATDGFEG